MSAPLTLDAINRMSALELYEAWRADTGPGYMAAYLKGLCRKKIRYIRVNPESHVMLFDTEHSA